MGYYGHEESTEGSPCQLQDSPRDEGTPRWTTKECNGKECVFNLHSEILILVTDAFPVNKKSLVKEVFGDGPAS